MIVFNLKGNKYYILLWSVSCGLMEVKKEGGKVARLIKYPSGLKVNDFMQKLGKINFC